LKIYSVSTRASSFLRDAAKVSPSELDGDLPLVWSLWEEFVMPPFEMLAQVDEEGHRQMLIDEIEDHRMMEDVIPIDQGDYTTPSGMKRKRQTTKGWELSVRWKDGSSTWIALKDLKDTYPVELANYAIANRIQDEPAFAWWVPYVTKKRTAIISKLRSKYWQRTHKYGIRVPRAIKEAKDIDQVNGDS
jgi:hypothetical protein